MKKKAFTLTELLVVVVIIGVLSAVVLPKFTKVLQTRKTTEAENVMAAVRNEQEARCMVGRNYTADTNKIASLPKAKSQNYTYVLGATGITAEAKDGSYTLQIPSYTDGRICCSGEGCDKLNRDYPKCGSIPNLETATCEAQIPDPTCNLTDYTRTCQEEGYSEEYTGSVTYTVNADCTGHTKTDTCTKSICEHPTNPDAADDCERSGGTWNAQDCTCDCPEGTHDDGSGTCVSEKTYCEYGKPGWLDGPKWADTAQKCEQPQDPAATSGTWNTSTCKCDCPDGTELNSDGEGCLSFCEYGKPGWDKWSGQVQSCEQPHPQNVAGVWNTSTCKCDCPEGAQLDFYGECVPACSLTAENLVLAQDCEEPQQTTIAIEWHYEENHSVYNSYPGTFNWDTCKCDCPNAEEVVPGLPYVEHDLISVNGRCYLHCSSNHSDRQSIEECLYGSASDRSQGIAVSGYWNQWSCQCQCATRYGAKERKTNGEVTSCYRDNCSTLREPASGWDSVKDLCECSTCKLGYDGNYWGGSRYPLAKGKWREEDCQCDCPAGTKLEGNVCRVIGEVHYEHYYWDDYWDDFEVPEMPDYYPDDPEEDDDYMGISTDNGIEIGYFGDMEDPFEEVDPSFFGLGVYSDDNVPWQYYIDVVVHRGDDDGDEYLGDEGWGYYD